MPHEPPLYRDRWITCEPEKLVIRGYYFPFGTRKSIRYRAIKRVETVALTTLGGRWRIWGASDPRFWFHLDWSRPKKASALILDVGHWVKPVITPDDAGRVAAIIEERRSTGG